MQSESAFAAASFWSLANAFTSSRCLVPAELFFSHALQPNVGIVHLSPLEILAYRFLLNRDAGLHRAAAANPMTGPFISGLPSGERGQAPLPFDGEPDDLDAGIVKEEDRFRSAVRCAVVCPDPERIRLPTPIRHLPCCAQVLLEDGSIWLLRTAGHAWIPDGLEMAGKLLLERGERRRTLEDLAGRLARGLSIPSLSVIAPRLDRADPDHWQTRKIAVALHLRRVARPGHSPRAQDLQAQVDALERGILGEIDGALGRFREKTDAGALRLATGNGLDLAVYNYLAQPQHRIARQQFAESFPVLLHAAASGQPGSLGAMIRNAVDARIPLVHFLSRELAVSPSAVRTLVRQPVARVGTIWGANLAALLPVLDVLRPEDRPRDDDASWARFNGLVETAHRIYGRRAWHSPLTLAWLREAARRSTVGRFEAQECDEADHDFLDKVAVMQRALVDLVQDSMRQRGMESDYRCISRIETVVDRYLAAMPIGNLKRLAETVLSALRQRRAALDADAAFMRGDENRPLLPQDVTSSDGRRRVTSLTTREALRRHGVALSNCLARSHLDVYFQACRRGRSFLLAVLDASSGAPISTAELGVWQDSLSPVPRLTVLQHTAKLNRTPSVRCRRAIDEILSLFEMPDHQRHLQMIYSDIAIRNARKFNSRMEQANLASTKIALQQALGEATLGGLIDRCILLAEAEPACDRLRSTHAFGFA